MARALFAVFFGQLKAANSGAHESPLLMLAPMLVMALLTLFLGGLAFWLGEFLYLHEPESFHFSPALAAVSLIIAAAGFAVGWLAYVRGSIQPGRIIARFPGVHRIVARAYYMDDAYQWAIDRAVLAFSGLVALFDRRVINDIGVNGTGESVVQSGRTLRAHVTGKVYNYAMGMSLGVLGLALLWWLAMR
jgi:NADH-quinone oxidoreductase subunit L